MSLRRVLPAVAAVLGLGLASGAARAQNFDTSGTSSLTGQYFFRLVLFSNINSNGSIGRARSAMGIINFDGNGNYTVTATSMDSQGSASSQLSVSGTYAVSSSRIFQMQNPIDTTQFLAGGMGADGALAGSTTEAQYNDIFIAIPANSGTGNSLLNASYTTAFIDFPNADVTQARDGFFTFSPNGQGAAADITLNGSAANLGSTNTTQSVTGVTYTITGQGSGTVTIPLQGASASSQLFSGTKTIYVSADKNLILGGSPNGFDMIFGFPAFNGTGSNATFQNTTYYQAGLEMDASSLSNGTAFLDSYYGSVLSNGGGTAISHYRFAQANATPIDYTFDTEYTVNADGTITKSFFQYLFSQSAQEFVITGRSDQYTFSIGFAAPQFSGGTVLLSPIGIVNAASYAPITNSVAPGEYVTLFGSGLSNSPVTASAPFQTTLGGVQVTVNSQAAPIYYVTPNQIAVIVPQSVTPSSTPYATFTVNNNGTASNPVTMFTNSTAPGMFSLSQNGVGPGAVLHADGTVVGQNAPAHVGETVEIFATGLGAITPAVADGAIAPSSPLAQVASGSVGIYFDGIEAPVSFAGLAPGFAALYQVNAAIPQGVTTGQPIYMDITTPDADTTETTIFVQ